MSTAGRPDRQFMQSSDRATVVAPDFQSATTSNHVSRARANICVLQSKLDWLCSFKSAVVLAAVGGISKIWLSMSAPFRGMENSYPKGRIPEGGLTVG